jgi:glycerol-3-phosphate dehydrogenase
MLKHGAGAVKPALYRARAGRPAIRCADKEGIGGGPKCRVVGEPPAGPVTDDAARRGRRARLAAGRFDVLVIGGGITGAGVALDAAARGLAVALVERGDFAGGTSSRSTKLVHGGLRYLPLGDLRQVREDLGERARLLRNAPHLVRPMPFVLPLYRGARRPLGIPVPSLLEPAAPLGIAAGLWTYDRLAGRLAVRPHRLLSVESARRLVPAMRLDGLRRAYLYYDAAADDARLVMAVLRAAQSRGAVALNYAAAVELLRSGGRITGARVLDAASGEVVAVAARTTVNAAGVWAEDVAGLAGRPPFHLRRAKGTHLVLRGNRLPAGRAALVLPETDDGRIAFIVPWQGAALLGTTDTEWTGPPDRVAPDRADVSYLLDHAARFLTAPPRADDIVSVFAGLRPLVGAARGSGATSGLSRRHEIYSGPEGFVTIVGGKLTTYRRMAEDAVNHILGLPAATPSPTRGLALEGAAGFFDAIPALRARARRAGLSRSTLRHLLRAYGTHAARVLEFIEERPLLAAPIADGQPHVCAEVLLAVREEFAESVEDVLLRRTRLGHLLPDQGRASVSAVAALMAAELGWSHAVEAAQVEAYGRAAARLAAPAGATAPARTGG